MELFNGTVTSFSAERVLAVLSVNHLPQAPKL